MLPAFATVSDLEARLREPVDGGSLAAAEAVLTDASTLVRTYTPSDYVTDDDPPELDAANLPDAVVVVTLAVAVRAWKNPDGYTSESLDGYSYVAAQGTIPGVYLTKAEQAMLAKFGGTGGVRSQRVVRPGLLETANRTEFLDVANGGEPMPWRDYEWWETVP